MAHASDYYLQLNDDGTPRRKHDVEERDARRPVFFSFAGFAFFSAFALMKSLWFGDDETRAGSQGRLGSRGSEAPHLQAPFDGDVISASSADPGDATEPIPDDLAPEAGSIRGSGIKFAVSPLDLNFSDTGALETARLGAPLAPPSNDNLRLYGAVPGQAISLPQSMAGGGGVSGGSAAQAEAEEQAEDDAGPVGGTSGGTPGGGLGGHGAEDDAGPVGGNSGGTPGGGLGGHIGTGSSGSDGSSSDPRGNRLPVVSNVVILSALMMNEAHSLDISELLRNAYDADGDSLVVANVRASVGHVVITGTGGLLYIPEFNDRSVVEFSYDIKDGQGSVAQSAFMQIIAGPYIPLTGTDQDDDLAVDPVDEMIGHIVEAGDGNDTVVTGAGDDVVYGSSGDDVISTGAGNDVIFAGEGNDTVYAGSGDDVVWGEDGDDILLGESGNDRLYGGAGNDILVGGSGDDVLIGGTGEDRIEGGDGNDLVIGQTGDGNDRIFGGGGNDVYIAATGDGSDTFEGGDGDDVFQSAMFDGKDVFQGGKGDDVYVAVNILEGDTFDGGEGSDTYDASAIPLAMIFDLSAGTVTLLDANLADGEPVEAEPDRLIAVENIIGGRGDDIFIADDAVNTFAGGAGEDFFVFQTVASAGSGKGSRDKILDFEVGDRIYIDDISEEFERDFNNVYDDPGIRKFVLIAQGQEFTQPGQLRFKYDDAEETTILEGNIDFDADTDFEIEILGAHNLRYDSYVYST